MSSTTTALKEAHDDLEYEVVEAHDNLTIPTSTPATFNYSLSPGVTNADELVSRLHESDLQWISLFPQNGTANWQFHVSGKAYDPETNEFCHVIITSTGVSVFQKEQDLSLETFGRVLGLIEETAETALEYRTRTDD